MNVLIPRTGLGLKRVVVDVFSLCLLSSISIIQQTKVEGFDILVPTSSEESSDDGSRVFSGQRQDYDEKTIDFNHERCQSEIVSGYYEDITHFYNVDQFVGENGVLELLVRFKGPSDGHVVLTPYANLSKPAYIVIMGSYQNKLSEIRLGIDSTPVFKINTPGILSSLQFRGFLIRYNEKRGEIRVYSEGSYMPLLLWEDPKPLKIKYFSFAAYEDVIIEVAFNCKPKDLHSLIFQHKPGQLQEDYYSSRKYDTK